MHFANLLKNRRGCCRDEAAVMDEKFDVVVIGGGPGGYVAAIRAAQLGLKSAVIEKKHLGGICLNWGCIPTKALLKGAEVAHTLRELQRFGFSADNIRFDIQTLVQHSRNVADGLSKGVAYLMKKNGITVVDGHATFTEKGKLAIDHAGEHKSVSYMHCIIASGARPRMIPGLDASHPRVWTYFEAMVPEQLPGSILVIGAGAIGAEFASLFADLGSKVTLVELADAILPAEDAAVSAHAKQAFQKRGMDVRTSASVKDFDLGENAIGCTIVAGASEERISFDYVVAAVGVQGNVEHLGLDKLGVKTDRGFIVIDEFGRTNVTGIYAIGDVAGPPCLAHKASHEGVICVEKLAGLDNVQPLDRNRIPACTYGRPQVASVGLSELAAKKAGHRVRIGRFDLAANGKALAIGEGDGFVKTVFDAETGELLGAHMIGAEVTEQIQGLSIAQALETTDQELIHTIFPHPTVSEAIHESVLAADGRAIHS
jgi:dihydrolipoamide dehydrogenase